MYRYLAVDSDGNTLLATDNKELVIKALYGELGEPAASGVLVLIDDGEYRYSNDFEESIANGWIYG